jgi:hypothetical protein
MAAAAAVQQQSNNSTQVVSSPSVCLHTYVVALLFQTWLRQAEFSFFRIGQKSVSADDESLLTDFAVLWCCSQAVVHGASGAPERSKFCCGSHLE